MKVHIKNLGKEIYLYGGIILGFIVGCTTGTLSMLGIVKNIDEQYKNMYVYSEDVDTSSLYINTDEFKEKSQLIMNFLDRNDIYNRRDIDSYKEIVYQMIANTYNDPYVVYTDKAEDLESNDESFEGIGITISKTGNTNCLSITEVNYGGPADKAGIRVGDLIYYINGEKVLKMSPVECAKRIKNDTEPVKISVVRDGKLITFEIEKETIEKESSVYKLLDDKYPYLSLDGYYDTSSEQATSELESHKKEINDSRVLIIDLRNNTGGLVEDASIFLGNFLGKDKVTATLEYKDGKVDVFKSKGKQIIDDDVKLIILTNGLTASASELSICALQDYGKDVTIVGETTFGKGITQTLTKFSDGSVLKYTSGYYYSPKKRNIHDIGIEPDIEIYDEESQLTRAKEIAEEMISNGSGK